MIKKVASPIPGHVRVIFELPSCLWADRIFLSGDFNNWRGDDIQLRQDRNGVWRAVLDLPVGQQYEFRYLIDGDWRTDSHADGHADNTFGSQNSLVIAELDGVGEHRRGVEPVSEREVMKTRAVSTAPRHRSATARIKHIRYERD